MRLVGIKRFDIIYKSGGIYFTYVILVDLKIDIAMATSGVHLKVWWEKKCEEITPNIGHGL